MGSSGRRVRRRRLVGVGSGSSTRRHAELPRRCCSHAVDGPHAEDKSGDRRVRAPAERWRSTSSSRRSDHESHTRCHSSAARRASPGRSQLREGRGAGGIEAQRGPASRPARGSRAPPPRARGIIGGLELVPQRPGGGSHERARASFGQRDRPRACAAIAPRAPCWGPSRQLELAEASRAASRRPDQHGSQRRPTGDPTRIPAPAVGITRRIAAWQVDRPARGAGGEARCG